MDILITGSTYMDAANDKPLISILIATRNRQKYAFYAAQSILSLKDSRFELIIQDNSDTDELKEQFESLLMDKRFNYRYTPPPLSSIGNFNAAIELAKGEYVCLIGDDDGVSKDIIEATHWAKQNNIDALVGSICANYRWAGTGQSDTLFTKMTDGTLVITEFSGKIEKINLEKALLKLIRNGGTYYLDYKFPKLYHGIVKSSLLKEMKIITGYYIGGLSPDIYAAVAFSCLAKNAVHIDLPLTIPGVCAASSSVIEGVQKKHSKEYKYIPHLKHRGKYCWSDEVPPIYCVESIWADSALAALRDFNRNDLIAKTNIVKLCAYIFMANKNVSTLLFNYMRNNSQINENIFKFYCWFILSCISEPFKRFLVNRVYSRSLVIMGKRRIITLQHLDVIGDAMNALADYQKRIHRAFKDCKLDFRS